MTEIYDEGERLMLTFVDAGSHTEVLVTGDVDSGTAGIFEQRFKEAIESGRLRFVVSLDNVELVTSAGLRVLLMLAKELKKQGGDIALYDCQKSVMDVFEMTGFDSILNIGDSYEQAVFAVGSTLDNNGRSTATHQSIH